MHDAKKIGLIGVASSAGGRQSGQEHGPKAMRNAGLVQQLESGGHKVLDLGDLPEAVFVLDPDHTNRQNLPSVLTVLNQVERKVESAVAERAWPLVLGGDCTITIGVLAALTKQFPSLGMIYLDGDADLNTPDTTITGILDGMVLAHVLGHGADELSHFGSRYPMLQEENITLFGYSVEAGGVDPVEIELIEDAGMTKYPMEDVSENVTVA